MLDKRKLTATLLTQLPNDLDYEKLDLESAMSWWQNPEGGLRLTERGYEVFKTLKIESYGFNVAASLPVVPNTLLTLDRKLTCPYFLKMGKHPKIIFFGSKEAMMFALYGDVQKFINSLY